MAGISLEQYREAEKRNRVIEANEFFASASTVGKNITDTLNNGGGNGNIGKQRIQSANLLKQAQRMRQMYANEGNKKMVKNIDLATNYLNNVNSHLDSVLSPETTIKEAFSDVTPTIPTQNNKTPNKFQKINYNIYNQNRNLSFDELNDKQAQYKREGKPEIYNQILEGLKSEKATDNDYKNAVETAKSRIKELDTGDDEGSRAYKQYMKMQNDNSAHGRYAKENLKRNHENSDGWKRAAEIDKYNDIINKYGDYAKYGKTNTEVWKQSVDGMSYKDKSDYINKLKTNEYEQQLKETIDKYPSGKEYISSLSEGEKPTAQGFLTWMEDNNRGFYSEQRGYEKNTNSNHMDVSTARNNLLNMDKKVNDWEQNSEERNNQIEYLDKYAKSTIQDNYEDYKALYDEYENKFDNSKSQSEQQDLALDFQKNYNQKYMELKQEHNYNLLDDQDKTELNRIVTSGADDTTLYDNLKKKYGFNDNEADAVVGYAEAKNNEEIAKQQQEEYREFGRKHPVTGTITSVPMSLTGGIGAVSNTWDRIKQAFGSERAIDWNNAPNRVSKNTQELREGVKDDINNELGNFVYDAFASTLDSAATIPLNMLVPGATTILLGSSAASSAMIDAHDKGASDSNAIMTGVGAGIFEGLFEKVSLDKLIDVSKNMTKKGLKNVLKGVAKSSMIEGSEEGFTEFANILWDSAVNGDLSDYGIALQQYMEQGMSESEAKKQTDKDMAKRIAMNVGGGMLGGLFFSMPAAGYGHVRNKANFEITNKGENIIKHNKNTELKEYIEDNYDKSSEVYQLMKNTDLENPGEVGYLSNAVELSEYQNSIQKFDEAMVPAVKSRLEELNVPESDATELAVKTIQNIGNRKDIDAGPYKEAYDQIKRDIREKNKGVSVEWLDNVDLTGQAEHIDKMKKIAGLSEGKSLKTEKQQEVQKQQEQLENNVNENVAEKMNEGRVVENGKASLVSDEDTKFNILSLAVGTDGRTKVNTDTRQTYDIDDVIVDRKTAELSEFANQYEGKDRQKFFRSYEENRNLSPAKFAMYYNEAYRYGNENLGIESALKNQRLTNVLNTDAIARAFDSGKAEYKQKIEQSRVITNNNNKGKVVFDNVAPEMLNDTQRAAVDLANTLSDVTGVTYEFFESKKNENGKYQGENGSYNRKENKIRIDINAGMISSTEGNNLMVVTLAHELTHYAENLAPAEYANLQEFVFNKLSDETGKSIEQLIADEIKKNGGKISEDVAKSELVARGCEAMLTDGESIKALAKQDAGLFAKIKTKIDQFCNKIIKACKEILNSDGSIKDSAISKEAQMLQNYAEELRGLWSEAVKSAGESNAANLKNIDTQKMIREMPDGTKYVEITSEKKKFEGRDRKDFPKIAKEIITEKFQGKVIGVPGKNAYVNSEGKGEYIHPRKPIKEDYIYDSKMKASSELDNMLKISEYLGNYPDGRDGHIHPDNKGGFDYYKTLFKVDNFMFEGVINIPITKNGRLFKDITQIKDVTEGYLDQLRKTQKSNASATSLKESISQNNKNDNEILKQDRDAGNDVKEQSTPFEFKAKTHNDGSQYKWLEFNSLPSFTEAQWNELFNLSSNYLPINYLKNGTGLKQYIMDNLNKRGKAEFDFEKEDYSALLKVLDIQPSMDSEGKQLSKEQIKYFEKSLIRTNEGNLKRVYHGSPNDFTIFDHSKIGTVGSAEGYGFYFTDSESKAMGYSHKNGNILSGYVNIEKPLSLDKRTLKKSEIKKLLKKLDPSGDDILSNYDTTGVGYPSKQWYNNALRDTINAVFENDNDADLIAEISNAYGDKSILGTVRKVLGYDGFIAKDKYNDGEVYVTFESNQFKNADNINPTSNEDIRYQVRQDADGRDYVEINEDILEGVNEDAYEAVTKKVLTSIFKSGIENKNNIFTMNKNDKNEFVRNKTMTYYLHNDNKMRLDKLRLSKNALEIIDNAKNWKNVEKKYTNTNNKHLVDFAYGYLNVSVLGNDYKVKVVMGADKFGNIHLYDIADMTPTKINGRTNTTVHSIKGASMFNGSSEDNISKSEMDVNKILKQDRNTDSSREILATALESTIKNDTERQYIKNYRDNIDKLYDLDKKLDVVNGALKEMYFMPGNKPTSTIKDLQKQANGIRIQMKRYENNLLKLESTKTLKNFVERENKAAATKQRHIDAQRLKEYRTKQNERFDRMQKRYQDAAKQKVENRKRIEARNKVIKRVDKLNKWLKKPNNKKYIPAKFMNGTVNLLQGLNQDVMNVAQRLDEVRAEMAGYTKVPQDLVNEYTELFEKNKQLKERTEALSKFYKAIETDPDYAGNYSQTVMEQIDKMKETVKDKPIGAMNVQELNVVKDTIDLLTNEITKWNETLDTKFIDGEENEMNIKEISDKAYKELVQRQKVSDNVVQSFINSQLSPTRFFKRIGGYAKNGVWEQLGEMLNDGQRDKLRYEQGAATIFDKVTSNRTDKNNQKNLARLKKEKVDIGLVDENGKPVEITKGMMLSVYKHLLNEENLRHAMYGGFTIPEFKDYYKGNRSKSYAQNKTRALGVSAELAQLGQKIQKAYDHGATDVEIAELENGHEEIIERGKMQMAKIKNTIEGIIKEDEYLKKWVDCSNEYFDKYSKNAINEVTMKRYSMKKAGVDNYYPIHTDSNYLSKGKEGKGSKAVNLENSGFMQDRVKSTKPIYLEDITNVVNDSISGTGTYVGFLIPQYNYNRILGYTTDGYKTNIKNALELRLGQQATNYLSNLEKDLFGGRSGDGSWSSRIMSKARGKVAQSALTLNIPVTAGQAASYFTAAPTVGWKNLAKAFAKGGKHGLVISSADRELINKYSPLLWYRNLGNVSQDIHDAKNADGVYNKINDKTNGYLFGWIQKADVATVGRLWYAAQYYVDDNFKDLEKGSDEYYKQTAKVFNKIVEETQPNYTVMQRPGVLRSQNEMVKALTMFSTQRMQNYNILFDSIATARRYRQDFKNGLNGVTAEDVKQANRTARRAVTSQIVSAAVLGIMKTAAALMLLQWKNFGDDENEFRKENVLKYGLDQFYSNVAGTIVGGSELYSFVSSIVNKSAYYGISLTGFDAITEFVSEIQDYALRLRTDEVSAKDTEKLIRNFSVVMGIPYAQAKKIYEGTTGWTKYTVSKLQGENRDLTEFAQTNEVTMTNSVKKIIKQTDFDKKTFDKIMKQQEESVKIKHPEYSKKEVDKTTRSRMRSRFTKELKEKYKANEMSKAEVIRQLKRTGLYTGQSSPYKTLKRWNKE